jgi:ElaB/YqjD/DUF883 family membrane-anchored ribosome-binding protein
MAGRPDADQLAAQAAEAVKQLIAEAESRAAEIIRDAEAKAASIRAQAEAEAVQVRERAQGDARAQIEAAKRALDELGGTLAAAASAAIPKAESELPKAETDQEPPPGPHLDPEPEQAAAPNENGDDAAERLVAMKLAVDGQDRAAIEAELIEKFGSRDRSALLDDVLARVSR